MADKKATRQRTRAEEAEREEEEEEQEEQPRRTTKKHNPHKGDYYRVAAGLTSVRGVHEHGEIVSHEEMGPGFEPLSPDIQEEKYGRVMYIKHNPDKEERRRLHLGHIVKTSVPVVADPKEAEEEEDEEVQETKELKNLSDDELWQMAQAEGLDFPHEAPRSTIEGALAKKMRDEEQQLKRTARENK